MARLLGASGGSVAEVKRLADERIAAPGQEWARRRRAVGASELAGKPLLVRELGSGTRDTVERALATCGTQPAAPLLELGSSAAIRNAVFAGVGPALLSEFVIAEDLTRRTLVEVPLADVDLGRTLHGVWRDRPARPPHCSRTRLAAPMGEAAVSLTAGTLRALAADRRGGAGVLQGHRPLAKALGDRARISSAYREPHTFWQHHARSTRLRPIDPDRPKEMSVRIRTFAASALVAVALTGGLAGVAAAQPPGPPGPPRDDRPAPCADRPERRPHDRLERRPDHRPGEHGRGGAGGTIEMAPGQPPCADDGRMVPGQPPRAEDGR
jgi:LysR substrate binding domain